MFEYLMIGLVISWFVMCDDEDLSRGEWLICSAMVALAWPVIGGIKIYNALRHGR